HEDDRGGARSVTATTVSVDASGGGPPRPADVRGRSLVEPPRFRRARVDPVARVRREDVPSRARLGATPVVAHAFPKAPGPDSQKGTTCHEDVLRIGVKSYSIVSGPPR